MLVEQGRATGDGRAALPMTDHAICRSADGSCLTYFIILYVFYTCVLCRKILTYAFLAQPTSGYPKYYENAVVPYQRPTLTSKRRDRGVVPY